MKRFSISLGLVLAALTLLAAGTPAHAGDRPIQAEGRGIFVEGGDYEALGGWGEGNHLGRCSLYIGLNYAELNRHRGNVVPQYLLLYAANGDRLNATAVSEFDPETGIVAGTITFAGGTGRFKDTTGSARFLIVPDTYWFGYDETGTYPIDGTRFSWALEGTIDY